MSTVVLPIVYIDQEISNRDNKIIVTIGAVIGKKATLINRRTRRALAMKAVLTAFSPFSLIILPMIR